MIKTKTHILIASLIGSLVAMTGCSNNASKPSPEGSDAIKVLKAAEVDARSGNEDKAIKEIEQAQKDLVKEDTLKPYPQENQGKAGVTGQSPREVADEKALKELQKAKKNAKAKLAGDAADEINQAIKDIQTKENAK
jgi:hypothetical protein